MDDNTAISRTLIILILAIAVIVCSAIIGSYWRDAKLAEAGYHYEYQGHRRGWYPGERVAP